MRKHGHHYYAKHRYSRPRQEKRLMINSGNEQGTRIDIEQETNRELAEKLLLLLNKTLNKFSVKIPH